MPHWCKSSGCDHRPDLELAFRLLAGHGWNVRWLTPAAQRINFPVFRGTRSEGAASAGAAAKLSTHWKLCMIGRDENESTGNV